MAGKTECRNRGIQCATAGVNITHHSTVMAYGERALSITRPCLMHICSYLTFISATQEGVERWDLMIRGGFKEGPCDGGPPEMDKFNYGEKGSSLFHLFIILIDKGGCMGVLGEGMKSVF